MIKVDIAPIYWQPYPIAVNGNRHYWGSRGCENGDKSVADAMPSKKYRNSNKNKNILFQKALWLSFNFPKASSIPFVINHFKNIVNERIEMSKTFT